MKKRVSYFICADTPAGDRLASDLVSQLRDLYPKFGGAGFGGEFLRQTGLEVIGGGEQEPDQEDMRLIEAFIASGEPKFIILVGFSGFQRELAPRLAKLGVAIILYGAPRPTDWNDQTIHVLQHHVDLTIGLLPGEGPKFANLNVAYQFAGSPHKDRVSKAFVDRKDLGIASKLPVLAVFPGSRRAVHERTIPFMWNMVKIFRLMEPDSEVIFVLVKQLSIEAFATMIGVESFVKSSSGGCLIDGIRVFHGMALEIMKISRLGLTSPGTTTLECAYALLPHLVVTERSEGSLINLALGQALVPEIPTSGSAEKAAEVLLQFWDGERSAPMKKAFQEFSDRIPGRASYQAALILEPYLTKNKAPS